MSLDNTSLEIIKINDKWNDLPEEIGDYDFYHTYDYYMIEKLDDGFAVMFKYVENEILIALPFIIQKIITTYDIDYYKFRLGHTIWMMQLDWFLKINIKIVDFSKGNIEYKKRWANKEYDFEYHLFYETTNFIIKMKAYWMSKKFQLLQILRDKNINTYYYKTLDWLNRNKESIKITNYQLVDQIQLPEKNTLQPILFRDNYDYFFLKRIIYSYLFQTSIHVDNLKIYKELKNDDIYYFQNQKKIKKLILEI